MASRRFDIGDTPSPIHRILRVFRTCRMHLAVAAILVCFGTRSDAVDQVVKGKVSPASVWAGQPVNLIITLYSPGPFSGTASFSIQELARTTFLKTGSPVVGSETIDGETWLTQRHEFLVFTQQIGEVVLPPIRVRFKGKKDFVSDAEPVEGQTETLRFQCNRPPGTEALGIVVAAAALSATQDWNPQPKSEGDDPAVGQTIQIQEGGVLRRQITRVAEGTTAMMLPPLQVSAPEGVKIYPVDPTVEDQTDRGDLTAKRVDWVKYQFQRSGEYQLPEAEVVWWDLKEETLRRETLPGLEVTVAGPPPSTDVAEQSGMPSPASDAIKVLAGIAGAALLIWGMSRGLRWWQATRMAPQNLAVRLLRDACRDNDLAAAYQGFAGWKRAVGITELPQTRDWQSLETLLEGMSSQLYSSSPDSASWRGEPFWTSFCQARRTTSAPLRSPERGGHLPPLNPTDSTV